MKRKYEIVVLSHKGYAATLRVYAPKRADRAILMHDGQNVFYDSDATYKKSWRALDMLKAAEVNNTAIIGIDSPTPRELFYMPFASELDSYGVEQMGGKGDVYCDFLEECVIPYLDKRFGFGFYGMLGSSLGGMITVYFASRNNARLKAYAAFSTPLFFCPQAFARFFESARFDKDCLYHIYTGGSETVARISDELSAMVKQAFVDDAVTVTNALRKCGVTDLCLTVNNAAVHDENYWREPERLFFKQFSQLDK